MYSTSDRTAFTRNSQRTWHNSRRLTRATQPPKQSATGTIGSRRVICSDSTTVRIAAESSHCATKGAVVMMTRQLAVDYPTQFRVNCICPGTVDTPFVEGYLEKYHKHERDKIRVELNARQPIGRLGKPEEIAYMALYLCSDQAAFVNGAVLSIDGGWTAA